MLVTPLSVLVQYRLVRYGGLAKPNTFRLSQLRRSTIGLFPEMTQGGSETEVPLARSTESVDQRKTGILRHAAVRARHLRPRVDSAIDQCHTDLDSLCRRVEMIIASRPIARTRIAFIGDDDLATVVLLQILPPEHLLLLEIDDRIIDAVETTAADLGQQGRLDIERVDLSSVDSTYVASRYGETFDLVVTDPPYATDGMLRFLQVAMALTAYTGEVHIAVPALLAEAWTDELLLDVQKLLVMSGFVIDRVIPGMFTYETSDVVSSLVVARRLPGGPPSSSIGPTRTGRFYTTRIAPAQEGLLSTHREEENQ